MPRAWPTPADFQEAIQAPHLVFTDPDLKAARPELGPLGLPRPRAGGFAVVFRMQSGRQSWAVKCFTREFEDQQRRYSAVAKALGAASLGFIANFQFLPHGMLVRGRTYPILKMEWFDGEDFKAYIQRHLRDAAALDKLASQFLDMTLALRNAAIAHGDLQDRNILVVRDCIRLIDYDGMYVPALAGMGSHELGARHYQHPHRNYRHFAPYLDNFPTWVIYLSLISLAVQPDLWHQFGGDDDERLLFRREDFEKPEHSPLINALERSPSPRVQELARRFKRLAGMPLDQIPSLDGNLSHHTAPTAYPDQNWWRDHVVHPATPSPRLSESSIRRDASADGVNRPGRALLRSGHLLLPTRAVAQIVVPTLSVLTSVLLVILFQAAAIGLDMLAGTTTDGIEPGLFSGQTPAAAVVACDYESY